MARSAGIQHDVVSAIGKAGGVAEYSWRMKRDNLAAIAWAPKWLVDSVGIDYCDYVHHISLRGRVSDTELVQISRLNGLQNLYLNQTEIRDEQLRHLKGMSRLRELSLEETNVGDAGLVHLKGLTGLQRLFLNRTNVGDAGLAKLEGLTELQTVGLRDTKVTKAGVDKLQKALPKLLMEYSNTVR